VIACSGRGARRETAATGWAPAPRVRCSATDAHQHGGNLRLAVLRRLHNLLYVRCGGVGAHGERRTLQLLQLPLQLHHRRLRRLRAYDGCVQVAALGGAGLVQHSKARVELRQRALQSPCALLRLLHRLRAQFCLVQRLHLALDVLLEVLRSARLLLLARFTQLLLQVFPRLLPGGPQPIQLQQAPSQLGFFGACAARAHPLHQLRRLVEVSSH